MGRHESEAESHQSKLARPLLSFGIKTVFVVIVLFGLVLALLPIVVPSPSYSKGVTEAKEQIRRGHVTFYVCGLRDFDRSYDPETGLPLEGIAGCMVDNSITERLVGHNIYVKRWLANGNSPPNSLIAHNAMIAMPFENIQLSALATLSVNTTIDFGKLRITYSQGGTDADIDHEFIVDSPGGRWSHTVFTHDAREFRIGCLANGKIFALTHLADGKESYAGKLYESVQLFDSYSGISLNYADREITNR